MRTFLTGLIFIATTFFHHAYSQNMDTIAVLVGKDTIYKSEVDLEYNYRVAMGIPGLSSWEIDYNNMRCSAIEELIENTLLLAEARKTLKVRDKEVDAKLVNQLNRTLSYVGSHEKFEEYYGKSVEEMRKELRTDIKNGLLVQKMKKKIWNKVTLASEEVKDFFESIPKDSLPIIPTEVELSQIVIKHLFSEETKAKTLGDLTEVYKLAISGTMSFEELANVYSMDLSTEGGFLGELARDDNVKEFEDVAFGLEKGAISPPFETEFGYHIVKLHERSGKKATVSHILLVPKIDVNDDEIAFVELDRIKEQIATNSIPFEEAVQKWSKDVLSKDCGGCIRNPVNGELRTSIDLLDADLYLSVHGMKEGEISEPLEYLQPNGARFYRLVYVKKRHEQHTANLKDDYKKLEKKAREEKQITAMKGWIEQEEKRIVINVKDKKCVTLRKKYGNQ